MGIKSLRCSATDTEFPNKNWKRRGIEDLLRKLQETGSFDHCTGSGRPCMHTHRAAVTTFLLFHFHKVAQVRYLDEVNMLFMYV